MRGPVKLTAKTAKELARQVPGVPCKLERQKTNPVMCIYTATIGELKIKIQNDWYNRNGLYNVIISTESSGDLWMYYDPETLKPDDKANQKALQEQREND